MPQKTCHRVKQKSCWMSLIICITWMTWKHKFLIIFQSICKVIQSTYQTPHTFIKYELEHHSFVRVKDCDFPLLPLLEKTVQLCVVFSQSTKESKLLRTGHLPWDFVVAICHRALMDRPLKTMEAQVMFPSTASPLWSAVWTYQESGNCPIITVVITNFMLNLFDLSFFIFNGYW